MSTAQEELVSELHNLARIAFALEESRAKGSEKMAIYIHELMVRLRVRVHEAAA